MTSLILYLYLLLILYADYLKLQISGRCFNGDLLSGTVASERAADRRVVGNTSFAGVGLLRADYLVGLLIFVLNVAHLDDAAEGDGVFRRVMVDIIDDFRVIDENLDLCDPGIQLSLLGLCLVVLTVFREVAEAAGFLDLLRDFLFPDGLQIIKVPL